MALKIVRDGRTSDLSAKLDELKARTEARPRRARRVQHAGPLRHAGVAADAGARGAVLAPALGEGRGRHRRGSRRVAADSGVQPNDVIEKVNGRATTTVAELKKALEHIDGKPAWSW